MRNTGLQRKKSVNLVPFRARLGCILNAIGSITCLPIALMNTPAPPADPSFLSSSSAPVVNLIPPKRPNGPTVKDQWKNEFPAEPKPATAEPTPKPALPSGDISIPSRRANGERIPAWLASTILHTLVILVLVLVQVEAANRGTQSILVSLATESEPVSFEPIAVIQEPLDARPEAAEDSPSQIAETATALAFSASKFVPAAPMEAATNREPLNLATAFENPQANAAGLTQIPVGGLYARDAKSRGDLGQKYGATPASEDAVEAALRWLAAHQQFDGSWTFDLSQEPCNGQCSHSKIASDNATPATAATGLAILAFLGAGYSQHEGIYADNVRRGIYFLRDAAKESNFGLDLQSGSMYGHGIAMMALAEAMAMTRYQGKQDSDLFSLVSGGASFTMAAQHDKGGWRYVPGSPGDMTVTCWQVLSLISAQHGGVVLRTDTLARAERYVRGLSKPDVFAFGYQTTDPKRTTTAVGLCMLLYLGQSPKQTTFGLALDRLALAGPKKTDVYHDYYATLALHHARHREWEAWHVPVREHLIKTQATKGHEAGSWHFKDAHGDVGGRLYTTAMSAMILEVYYRYLPLYQTQDEFKLD